MDFNGAKISPMLLKKINLLFISSCLRAAAVRVRIGQCNASHLTADKFQFDLNFTGFAFCLGETREKWGHGRVLKLQA